MLSDASMEMRYSTLKHYAAGVCLVTGLCFAVAFGKGLWDAVQVYIHQAEQTDIYRFYHDANATSCNTCNTPVADGRVSLIPPQPTLSHYGQPAASQVQARPVPTSKPTPDSRSALHDLLVRLVLAGTAGMIFFLHWRLYRNLSAVTE